MTAYSLLVIAPALAKAFDVGINDPPISYNIAWYEQKAVFVLLVPTNPDVTDITLAPPLFSHPSSGGEPGSMIC